MLTGRQQQVLELRADGMSGKQIARRLGCRESTVASHSKHARERLGGRDMAHAVAIAFRKGLLPLQNEETRS
jgi:DNA-binding NarL/FixJ family response regulator